MTCAYNEPENERISGTLARVAPAEASNRNLYVSTSGKKREERAQKLLKLLIISKYNGIKKANFKNILGTKQSQKR